MAFQSGHIGTITVAPSGWTTNVNKWTVDDARQLHDTTVLAGASTVRARIGGLYRWRITVEGFIDSAMTTAEINNMFFGAVVSWTLGFNSGDTIAGSGVVEKITTKTTTGAPVGYVATIVSNTAALTKTNG